MLLIDLPPELLQLVLLHCSTPSFVQLIRTCHTFFDLAAQTRDVVAHHLRNIPGENLDLPTEFVSTKELFLTLRQRAAASLQAVNLTANRHDFYFHEASVDINASCITSMYYNNRYIALVERGGSSVHLYQASRGELEFRGVVDPRSGHGTLYRPLQTAFDTENNLHVLYNTERTAKNRPSPRFPCVTPWHEATTARGTLKRVKLSDPFAYQDSWDIGNLQEDRVEGSKAIRAVAMAAYGANTVAIAWDYDDFVGQAKYIPVSLYSLSKGK
jgi:hypothetical protein